MLQLKNIVKDYGEGDSKVQALKGVSINFRANEFVSILGHSGCGKTTLLNIVGGLDQYTDGDLIIKGKTTKKYKDKDWDTYVQNVNDAGLPQVLEIRQAAFDEYLSK